MSKQRTILELSNALQSKEMSSVEVTEMYLDALKRDSLNVAITVNEDARTLAKKADEKIKAGNAHPLTGIPIGIKDTLTTRGLRTTAASKMLDSFVPTYSATSVQRLEDAGMIVIAKMNCDEFAMGSSNENSAYGPVSNPHDESRVAGGSSGGSAAGVASGAVPVALGSDTGGSIRQPAALSGVYGLKPTYGRVSRYGLIAMASSLDQVGVLSNSAEDAALILQEMAGVDPNDMTSSTVSVPDYQKAVHERKKIRLGIPKELFSDYSSSEMEQLISGYLAALGKEKDIELVDISLPHTKYALATYYIIMPSEASTNLARYDGMRYGSRTDGATLEEQYAKTRSEFFGDEVKRRILLGTFSLSSGYYDAYYKRATQVRRLIKRDYDEAFKDVDLVLSPVTPTTAFKKGEKDSDPLTMYLADIYTISANLAGIPGFSFPIGVLDGLPVGMQIVGPAWSEGSVLNFGHRFSAVDN